MIKGICLSHTYNPTANTMLSGKPFPPKIRNKARMTAFATSATSIQLEVPIRAMRKYKEKKYKEIIGKEEVEFISIHRWHNVLYRRS